MPIKIIGNIQKIKRVQTGLYSFDKSFENVKGATGFPIGTSTEISGPTGCGKSTLVFGLSGLIAKENKTNIALADFEGFDPDFMVTILENSGFDGNVYVVQEDSDEKTLDDFIEHLKNDAFVGILDSIGAISPIAEAEGNLGEANMGKRAKLMAQFSRRTQKQLRDDRTRTVFMINHVHPNIGGFGSVTPGGETTKYLTAIRIRIKRKEDFDDQSYVLEGTVTKNRFGYKDRKFHIFMLAGTGIHVGLTALWDCLMLDLAERAKNIKMDGQSYGFLGRLVKEAHEGNNEPFEPFIKKLEQAKPSIEEIE